MSAELADLVALGFAALIAAGGIVVALRVDPAWVVSVGIGLSVFSGNWGELGLPFGIDRLVIVGGIGLALLRWHRRERPRLQPRAIHAAIVLLGVYAIGSAVWSGTLTESESFFALLDQLGLIPFALLASAPVVFATPAQRRALLITLTATALYLTFIALAQTLKADVLLFPRYIADPGLGIHAERARGPFLEASANGGALFTCAIAAMIWAASHLTDLRHRRWVGVLVLLAAIGIVGTVTRQVWLSTAVASVVTLAAFAPLRRYLLPVVIAGALVVGASLVLVPGLADQADERAQASRPVWDRYNSNRAALEIFKEKPLLGAGWDRFEEVSRDHYIQAPDYPVTDVAQLHNVVLALLTGLGAVGLVGWLLVLGMAVIPALHRRGPELTRELRLWQMGLVAVLVNWLILLNFTPLRYAFMNYAVWVFIGVVAGMARAQRVRSRVPAGLARPAPIAPAAPASS